MNENNWCNNCNNFPSSAPCNPPPPLTYKSFRDTWTQIGQDASTFLTKPGFSIIPPTSSQLPLPPPVPGNICQINLIYEDGECRSPIQIPIGAFVNVIQGAQALITMASLNCGACYGLIKQNDLLGPNFAASLDFMNIPKDLPSNVFNTFSIFRSNYNNVQSVSPVDKPPCPNPPDNCAAFQAAWKGVAQKAAAFLATLTPSTPTAPPVLGNICQFYLQYP